ncbi:MFS transporter [Williamwhitmania taraxaci]|nr:MFS transporter [Williamwhitmania taraxaci]
MSQNLNQVPAKKGFSKNYWTVILMEFFERGSYYGVMSVLSVYLVLSTTEGGLGFSKESVGVIKSTITPLLYFLPILSGAIADRYGYRKTLFFAFAVMSTGYFLTSQMTSYTPVFLSLIFMAVGAGFFKPIISGTIARETNESNSSLGFGIYYWSINMGAFLVPLLLIPYLKSFSWTYIFLMAGFGTGWLLLVNFFIYKEPARPKTGKSVGQVLADAVLVLKDYRFILMIIIYSGFWILYFQMFDSVLWFLKEKIDTTPVNGAINSMLSLFIDKPNWHFDAEHVTVVNALTIICLQLVISKIVNKFKALPTMIFGIGLGTMGIAMLAISSNVWVFIFGLFIFSLGEMTAHPKFISYVGLIAPPDKKALYLGYSFLYGVIGSGVGGILGATLYVSLVEKQNNGFAFWGIFVLIGIATMIGLLLFNKFLAPRKS